MGAQTPRTKVGPPRERRVFSYHDQYSERSIFLFPPLQEFRESQEIETRVSFPGSTLFYSFIRLPGLTPCLLGQFATLERVVFGGFGRSSPRTKRHVTTPKFSVGGIIADDIIGYLVLKGFLRPKRGKKAKELIR